MKPIQPLVRLQAWWLLALIFFIPISLKYIWMEPFAISSLNLLSVGFVGLGIINLMLGYVPYKPVRYTSFAFMLIALLLALAYALLFTHPLRNGIGLWTSRLLQPLLVGFFTFQLLRVRAMTLSKITGALFWSLVPLFILGGMQAAGLLPYADPGRITASYTFPNTFARYIDIILLVTLPWLLLEHIKPKWLYVIVWFLGVVLLVGTKSYNGVVSFYVGVIIVLILLPSQYKRLKKISLTVLLLLAVVVSVNAPRLPKWQTSINDSRLTRLEFWQVARGIIRDNFWTGIGIKTWELQYPKLVEKYGPYPPLNWGSAQPHNVFLDSFVKAGLPGFLAITWFLLWPLSEAGRFIQENKKNPHLWFGLSILAYSIALVVFGLIDDPLWSDDVMPLRFILLFGFVWLLAEVRQNKEVTAAV
jgi:O-antigen ligase